MTEAQPIPDSALTLPFRDKDSAGITQRANECTFGDLSIREDPLPSKIYRADSFQPFLAWKKLESVTTAA